MFAKYLERRIAAAVEERASYTDLIVAGLEATAIGTTGSVFKTGALESAAGMYARILAAARVEGTDALTARTRYRIGRDLVRSGESVHLVDTGDGRLRLTPVSSFDIRSGFRYALEIPQPPGGKVLKRTVARDGVLHVLWSEDPAQPWRGCGPLTVASGLAKLAGASESKLAEELEVPSAAILPVPPDGAETVLQGIRTDIGSAKGRALMAESTVVGPDGDGHGGTQHDWKPSRLGPAIPSEMRLLHLDTTDAVFGACGIPASLASRGEASGTQLREDYRRWVQISVEPVAAMIADVASEVLESEIRFDFTHIWAHDLTARATAFQKMVQAGMAIEKAVQVSGLMVGAE